MPKRELRHPHQVEEWLQNWGQKLTRLASLILIGSAAPHIFHQKRTSNLSPLKPK